MKNKIVIVDDAPFIREVVHQLLSKSGYQIVGEAENGEEAIQVVLENEPDLVLMDIVLPIKSGIEATKAIKERLPDIKVLACSTVDNEAMVMRALEAGCEGYVTKPFKAEELLASIHRLLGDKAKEKSL